MRHDLLVDVQRRIESLYAVEPHAPVTDFLVSEAQAGRLPGGGSRTVLQQDGDELSVGVVIEGEVRRRLAQADPRVRLDRSNLDPFCILTEEVSHFVYVMFCARAERSVTQLELELQGEVDKYLNAVFLLSSQNEGAFSTGLRELLFRHWHLRPGVTGESAERYRAASELGFRYTGWLEREFLRPGHASELAREARRFYRLGQREKLERIAAIAA